MPRSTSAITPERAVRDGARAAMAALAERLPVETASTLVLRVAFLLLAERRGLSAGAAALVAADSIEWDASDEARAVAALAPAFDVAGADQPEMLGAAYEGVSSDPTRRRVGAYFTPRRLCEAAVRRAMAPLLAAVSRPSDLLDLRICDPAMGCGAFLLEASRQMSALEGADSRGVVRACLCGVDRDPATIRLARLSLWLLVAKPTDTSPIDAPGLVCGDSLIGARAADLPPAQSTAGSDSLAPALDAWTARWFWPDDLPFAPSASRAFSDFVSAFVAERRPLHFELAFSDVFSRDRPGFDAIVGNPPWIAYAGRAAQPIEPAMYRWLSERSPAFGGYRTLHGVFVHRAASLLREGGRLGLVVPTSISDLAGYAPARRAHDELCIAEPDLEDFGARAFDDVFQPAMALVSTRVAGRRDASADVTWSLARDDLDDVGRALLDRLAAMPPVDPTLFGERGFQSLSTDAPHILRCAAPTGRHTVPIREGTDIGDFVLSPARHHIDPEAVGRRLRDAEQWREVAVLIRQTARWPIVAPSDGVAFRNSILAGFARDGWTAPSLAAFLSSAPIRWLHYVRFRDARQGMPQVKIAHLRALPDPGPRRGAMVETLTRVAARPFARHGGLAPAEREAIDAAVIEALQLEAAERACVRAWDAQWSASAQADDRRT